MREIMRDASARNLRLAVFDRRPNTERLEVKVANLLPIGRGFEISMEVLSASAAYHLTRNDVSLGSIFFSCASAQDLGTAPLFTTADQERHYEVVLKNPSASIVKETRFQSGIVANSRIWATKIATDMEYKIFERLHYRIGYDFATNQPENFPTGESIRAREGAARTIAGTYIVHDHTYVALKDVHEYPAEGLVVFHRTLLDLRKVLV